MKVPAELLTPFRRAPGRALMLGHVHPDADELCSTEYDDDCEGGANEADAVDAPTWYEDFDEDTFGNPLETLVQCTQPVGYVEDDTDCNDEAGTVHPDADDVACDGFDNDCDPLTFEASAFEVNGAPGTGSLATAGPARRYAALRPRRTTSRCSSTGTSRYVSRIASSACARSPADDLWMSTSIW